MYTHVDTFNSNHLHHAYYCGSLNEQCRCYKNINNSKKHTDIKMLPTKIHQK